MTTLQKATITGLVTTILGVLIIVAAVSVASAVKRHSPSGLSAPSNSAPKAIRDLEAQYDIAVRGGNIYTIAKQSEVVADAYLKAQDEPNYNKWKKIAGWAKLRTEMDPAYYEALKADSDAYYREKEARR